MTVSGKYAWLNWFVGSVFMFCVSCVLLVMAFLFKADSRRYMEMQIQERTVQDLDAKDALESLRSQNELLRATLFESRLRLDRFQQFYDAQAEAQNGTLVRPDFNPTLGGVPHPGMGQGPIGQGPVPAEETDRDAGGQ